MTAKRFRVNELVKYNYSDIGEYIDENHTDRPLRNDILVKILNELYEKNAELHIQLDFLKDENRHMRDLVNENKQLQERNNRQCKQLNNLYNLIEKQDWKTLKGLIQEFQECEEQLQRESGTYW